jgi:repressor LexA
MNNEYKNILINFYQANKRMPTYTEIMKLLGMKSKNAVFRLVNKLIEAGMVKKDHLGRLLPAETFGEIPMLGSVTAGFPVAVDEELQDTLSLEDYLIEKKDSSYILEVDGDSMIDAHIADGDMVIVERTNKAKDGDIVVANVDGDWTLKYFRQKGTKMWLEPANKKYKPIYPEHDLKIAAKLKAVIRKY